MAKGERRRTMVYSNVNNKKADVKSASNNEDRINLDNEIVIGLASFPKPNEIEKNKKTKKFKKNKKDKKIQKDEKVIENQKLTVQERIRRQKKAAIRKMGALLLLAVLIIGALVYFFLSPVFNVRTIIVMNNNHISKEQIISLSEIGVNENIFKFSKKVSKNAITSNPYIEDVKISRNIFTKTVEIDVKERAATLMLEYGNSYVYINNQGYILEISSIKLDSPIIKGYTTQLSDVKPGNRLCMEDLEKLETVLKIMETASSNGLEQLITHIDMSDRKNYVITLESEDKTVYLGDCLYLSTQMLYVKEMVQREKGIEGEFFVNMDLNTSNPVFREKV